MGFGVGIDLRPILGAIEFEIGTDRLCNAAGELAGEQGLVAFAQLAAIGHPHLHRADPNRSVLVVNEAVGPDCLRGQVLAYEQRHGRERPALWPHQLERGALGHARHDFDVAVQVLDAQMRQPVVIKGGGGQLGPAFERQRQQAFALFSQVFFEAVGADAGVAHAEDLEVVALVIQPPEHDAGVGRAPANVGGDVGGGKAELVRLRLRSLKIGHRQNDVVQTDDRRIARNVRVVGDN